MRCRHLLFKTLLFKSLLFKTLLFKSLLFNSLRGRRRRACPLMASATAAVAQ